MQRQGVIRVSGEMQGCIEEQAAGCTARQSSAPPTCGISLTWFHYRPVDRGKTSLMVLIDQLDLLGATMDQVFDAVCREDAQALVVHGRFLQEKFGSAAGGGDLRLGSTPLSEMPTGALSEPGIHRPSAQGTPQGLGWLPCVTSTMTNSTRSATPSSP